MTEKARTVAAILAEGIELRLGPTDAPQMAVRLFVVGGDFARLARDVLERRELDLDEALRELANLVLSCARWIVELGGDLAAALEAALASQKAYAGRLAGGQADGGHLCG